MRRAFLLLGALVASPALAQTAKPLVDTRLRSEHAEQNGLPRDADAVTLRVRTGVEVTRGLVAALVEAQGTLAIVGNYYDGLSGSTTRPLVADPQNVSLYRAQLRYRSPLATLTAGRQRIALDDERFVGNVAFRQNAQTFDAVRAELRPAKNVRIDASYVWSVRTIWGIDGVGARQRAIDGDNVFLNAGWTSPVGTLSAFAYLVDQDEAAVQGFRLSSQSYGVRLAGTQPIEGAKLAYQLSHARQSDWHRNPNDYAARYWLADATVDVGGPRLGAGYEVLGADDGRALTNFQTPLGTNFKFQGWADKFLTTPPDGVRDLYASVGHGWKAIGRVQGASLQAVFHRFTSDRLVRRYGDELDLLAQGKLGRTTASLRYATYWAGSFATDTRKLWLQLDWTI